MLLKTCMHPRGNDYIKCWMMMTSEEILEGINASTLIRLLMQLDVYSICIRCSPTEEMKRRKCHLDCLQICLTVYSYCLKLTGCHRLLCI